MVCEGYGLSHSEALRQMFGLSAGVPLMYPKIVYNLALNGDLQALRKWFNLQRKWGKEFRWRDIMSCKKLK